MKDPEFPSPPITTNDSVQSVVVLENNCSKEEEEEIEEIVKEELTVEEERQKESIDVELTKEEEEVEVDDTDEISFGNFADLGISFPPKDDSSMEFGVKVQEKSAVQEWTDKSHSQPLSPDSLGHSQPLSPDSLGRSETSGTDVFFDAVEEKSAEEDRYEVCPESLKESGKSSAADSTEWAAGGKGAKCWASLFRNTKQATEAVVVNKLDTEEFPSDFGVSAVSDDVSVGLKNSEELVVVPFERDPSKMKIQSAYKNFRKSD